MGKSGLSRNDQLMVIKLYKQGLKTTEITAAVRRNVCVNFDQVKFCIKRFKSGHISDDIEYNTTEKPCGNFKVIKKEDIDFIKGSLSENPIQSARDIQTKLASNGTNISKSTTRRAISAAGFTNTAPRYCQMIRNPNKIKRVDFCKQLIDCDETFDDVIFSDESSIQLHGNKQTCYRQNGSGPIHLPKPKHPLKLHVWAAISKRGASRILIFKDIMRKEFFTEKILKDTLLPYIQTAFPNGHRFQQDNDPKHKSKLASNFMEANGINWWREWPSESPDLNPIEMMWNELKMYVDKLQPRTEVQLIEAIQAFWNSRATPIQCRKYIEHNFKTVPVCYELEGRATGDTPKKLIAFDSLGSSIKECYTHIQLPKNKQIIRNMNVAASKFQ